VDYALDWTAFGGERPPSTSVHIHGMKTLHTDSAEMLLKAFISLLHGVKHVDIRPNLVETALFDAYIEFTSIENASAAVSKLTSKPPELVPPEHITFARIGFRK